MMSKYLQVIWLYIIGIMVILVGVYILMLSPGPASFLVMLVGLGVAAIGAAHGRKMRTMGQFDIEQMMRERGFGEPARPEAGQEQVPEQAEPAEEEAGKEPVAAAQEPPEEKEPAMKPSEAVEGEEAPAMPTRGGLLSIFKRKLPEEPLTPDQMLQIEMEDIKSGKLVPTEADIIELVCPRCGAENDEKNFFCYSCGNKLRRKPSAKAKVKEPKIAVEPGAIKIVGEKRIAKVVICPKCNAANKETDKFCSNCGKKLRTEREKKKKQTDKK